MRLKDEDCAIILTKIEKVKESLHKLGRKFSVCMFLVPMAALAYPISNVTPPNSITTMPKDTTSLQGYNGLLGFKF